MTPAASHILYALFGEPLHGYAIMKKVDDMTGGTFRLGPGTLYRSLDRLQEMGLVRPLKPSGADERRIPYKITAKGRGVVEAEIRTMRGILNVLEPEMS